MCSYVRSELFDLEKASAVDLVREILRITGTERWEALVKIICPPTDPEERKKADEMLINHVKNVIRVNAYIERLKDMFRIASARRLVLEQQIQHRIKQMEASAAAAAVAPPPQPPKRHYGNKKYNRRHNK